jgi:putative transposase
MGNGHNLHQDASGLGVSGGDYGLVQQVCDKLGISNTMDVHFCLGALGAALARHKPNIFNSGQASQFTSRDFTEMLETAGIGISMDGRGRVYDNIFIERLWRTVKYEEVYLHNTTIREVKEGLKKYFLFYNEERFHRSLNRKTPAEVYFGGKI